MFNFEVVCAGSDDVSTTVAKLITDNDVIYNVIIVCAGMKTKHQKSVTVNVMATFDNFSRFGGSVMVEGKACAVSGEAELKVKQ